MKIIANICLQLTLFSLLILTFSCEQFKNKSNNSARSRSVSEIDSSISAQQFETNESSFDYNSPFLKGLTGVQFFGRANKPDLNQAIIDLVRERENEIIPEDALESTKGDLNILGWEVRLSSVAGKIYDEKNHPKLVDESEQLVDSMFSALSSKPDLMEESRYLFDLKDDPILFVKNLNEQPFRDVPAKFIKKAKILGRNFFHYDDKLFLVAYIYQTPKNRIDAKFTGFFWEVDFDSKIVRKITGSGDLELISKYRLK